MDVKISYAAKVGFTVILAIFVLLVTLSYLGVVNFVGKKQDEYNLYFHFPSIRGLNKGAKFKINGREVGYVEQTNISPLSGVSVSVRIYGRENVIHENAEVIITKESLLGSSYIEVTEPIGGAYDCADETTPDHYYIKVIKGTIRNHDWLHYYHDGEEKLIGQVVSLNKIEPGMDRLRIRKIDKSISIDKTCAFVPEKKKFWDNQEGKYSLITYLNVFPPLGENAYFQGSREAGPEDLIAHIDEVVQESGLQLKELNQEMLTVLIQFQGLLEDIEELVDKDAIEELFATVKVQIETIGTSVEGITVGLNELIDENKSHLTNTMINMEKASESMRVLVEDPELQNAAKNISERIDSLTMQLESILSDIEEITGDPELKGELKESVHSVHRSLKATEETVMKLKKKIDTASDLEFKGEFKSAFRPEHDSYFSSVDLFVRNRKKNVFFTVGVDDIGEANLLNLQLGYSPEETFDLRFGVKRSKIGFGMDYHLNKFFIKSDLYDPNDIVFDIYGGLGITDDVFILIGAESVFEDDIFSLGIQYDF